MNDKQPTINGSGNYSRDFTYIDNVVQANILALTTENENTFGEVFNIGAGGRVTIIELFNTIKEELGVDIFPIYGPLRDGDIPHSNASIDKANRMLRYFPTIKFNEGIKNTVDYFKLRMS